MNINFLKVGKTIECGSCHPEKFEDCEKLEKEYNLTWKCNCVCHQPEKCGCDEKLRVMCEQHVKDMYGGEPEVEKKECNGMHCKCMNLDGECENTHAADCKEHNPYLKPRECEHEWFGVPYGKYKCKNCDVPKPPQELVELPCELDISKFPDFETRHLFVLIQAKINTLIRYLKERDNTK